MQCWAFSPSCVQLPTWSLLSFDLPRSPIPTSMRLRPQPCVVVVVVGAEKWKASIRAGRVVQFRTREHRRTHTQHTLSLAWLSRQDRPRKAPQEGSSRRSRNAQGGANQQNGIELKVGGGGGGGWLRSSIKKRLYRGWGRGCGPSPAELLGPVTTTDEPGERTNRHELRQWSSPTPAVQAPPLPDSQRQRIDFHEAGWWVVGGVGGGGRRDRTAPPI